MSFGAKMAVGHPLAKHAAVRRGAALGLVRASPGASTVACLRHAACALEQPKDPCR